MESIVRDIRYAFRMLAKNPGFSAAAILCLMLGIGATSAIFSVVNAVLLRPLPYEHPEQLIRVYSEFPNYPNGGLHRFWFDGPEMVELQRDAHSFQTLDGWYTAFTNVAGQTQPVRINTASVSGHLLETLGVSPIKGRLLAPSDDAPGANLVIDISYSTWQSVFGADQNVVGRDTLLNNRQCTVVGVMPPGFEFPPGELDPIQIWRPLQLDPANPGSSGTHYLYLVGRLSQGVSSSAAQGELENLVRYYGEHAAPKSHSFQPEAQNDQNSHTIVSFPMQAEVVSSVRPALLVLLGAVLFVLLIACVNVANLLLARAEARRREIAIRGAMGASISRLARQFATEGVVLALSGAILGLGLAFGGLRLIQLTNAGAIPRAVEISIDWRVLLFTGAVSIATGILFGLAPIASLLISDIANALKETAGSTTAGGSTNVFRRALVAGEISLALILLIGCGLMIRAFWKLQEVNVGLQPENMVTMRVSLPPSSYSSNATIDSFWARLEPGLKQIPGVGSEALFSELPPVRPPDMNYTQIEGFVPTPGGPIQNVDFWQIVSPSFFQTMGIRLLEGRFFDERDGKGAPDVAVINESMAKTFWPGLDPIGRRINAVVTGSLKTSPWVTIVGVVADVKNSGIDRRAGTELYLPFEQRSGSGQSDMYIGLRAQGVNPLSLTSAVRNQVYSLDSSLAIAEIRTMEEVISRAESRPRFLTLLLSLFSGVALAIAAVGIYGVISFAVARRTKEFGLRMCLGAQRADVLALVMKQGAGLAVTGIVVGLIGAFALTRLMASLLFGVTATDPLTYSAVTAILATVALSACYIPARRATKVDPIRTLRDE